MKQNQDRTPKPKGDQLFANKHIHDREEAASQPSREIGGWSGEGEDRLCLAAAVHHTGWSEGLDKTLKPSWKDKETFNTF